MDKNTRKRLDEANWREITPRLVKYALKKVTWLRTMKYIPDYGDINDIISDVVNESIAKVYDGTVTWNPNAKPDLTIFMKSVIKSPISHLYDSKEYKTTQRIPAVQAEHGDIPVEIEELMDIASKNDAHAEHLPAVSSKNPEEVLLERHDIEKERAILEELYLELQGDSELGEMLLCMMSGYSKRQEIAEQMNISVSEVTNITKRFDRALNKFIQKKWGYDESKER